MYGVEGQYKSSLSEMAGHDGKELEEEPVMAAITRRKAGSGGVVQVVTGMVMSYGGLTVLCCLYAVLGVGVFISLEQQAEEERYLEKREAARELEVAEQFLPDQWWTAIHTNNPHRRLNSSRWHKQKHPPSQ